MDRRRPPRFLLVVAVLGVLLGGAVTYASPLLLTGTGYAAHNACAVQLLAGRDAAAPDRDLPDNPLVPVLSTTVDAQAGVARSSVLGLFAQEAWYTPGLGCTLAEDRPDLPVPVPVAAAPALPTTAEGADVAAVSAALDTAFAEDDPQGRSVGTRAVVVLHEGQVVAERYADGFDADTRQLGWSMAKSVTNAMVGRLVLEGALDVDRAGLQADWTDGRAAITVDQLLRMSSGLEWDEAYSLGSTITRMLYLEPDMGGFAADQPLAHPPGTYQEYSSGTTNILCSVLDGITALGVDMPAELVFAPLGMSSAVLEPDAAGAPVCSSYLWATPRDWARFGQLFAQDGVWEGQRLLPEGWVEYSTSLLDEVESEEEGFAAHWWVNAAADGSPLIEGLPADTFWAAGHDGQRVFVIPSADMVVVRMGFTPDIPSAELGYDRWVPALVDAVGG